MKRITLAAALILALAAVPLAAQGLFDNLGQLHVSAGFGAKSVKSGEKSISTTPVFAGLEVGLLTLPKNVILGLRANGSLSKYSVTNYGGTNNFTVVGPSVMLGAHWGLENLETGSKILDNIDLFGGLGLGLVLASYTGISTGSRDPEIKFGYSVGAAYYPKPAFAPFLKNLGVTLESSNFATIGLGLVYKL